ncbi:uncharacterized protein LOC129766699 [Toxorhynchites rutilus septentrionalis]|uniref:uncharacterized protein LOC129766699 n=1 Tax=Toxorhynchites rutilus septentrionalis TaxID=329112 RepID=UPI002478DF51|nr:uncharacterized protein LOC129766699 [Toxorhynchites rutilus septentrionalis]
MEVKRMRVTNCKQFELMVARMEAHPAVAKGLKFCEASRITRESYLEIWNDLTTGLNSLGPPTRSVHEWQKVWTDFKLKVKRKLAHNKRETEATGGGPNQFINLSSTEEAVVNLLSLDCAVYQSGLSSLMSSSLEIPIPPMNDVNEQGSQLDELQTDDIENAKNNRNHESQNRRKREILDNTDNRLNMLVEQTKYLKRMVANSEECARYARKTFKLKEQQAKECQAYKLRKEKQRQEELQYKIQLLEYKKKKLCLLERQAGKNED